MLDMNAIGPMARHVEDLKLLLPVLAGPDGIDPFVGPAQLAPPAMSPLRIAVYEDDGVAHPNTETRVAVRAVARALADSGCAVETVAPPDVSEATNLFFAMMAADGGARARADLAAAGGRHVPQMAELLDSLEPLALDASGFFGLFARWAGLRARVRAFVAPYDVVVAPVTVGAAPLHGCTPGTDTPLEDYTVFNFTHTYSVAGLPVAVVPAGSQSGLPIGVQLVANPFHDRTALAAAALLEAADPAGTGP
jgi:Asp-tRNA(Asn)/Glu-tRNA(Gln) amidotransferase A subunit family amidase